MAIIYQSDDEKDNPDKIQDYPDAQDAPEIDPEDEEAQEIERQINEYQTSEHFKERLQHINFNHTDRQELLTQIEKSLCLFHIDYVNTIYLVLLQCENYIVENHEKNLRGLAYNLINDQQMKTYIEILRIKYLGRPEEYIEMPIEFKIGLTACYITAKTYIANKRKQEEEEEFEME